MPDFGKTTSRLVPAPWIRLPAIFLGLLLLCARLGLAAEPAYKLGPGDKLRVTVFNEKSLSGDYEVSDQGMLAMPLIGPVNVGTMTIRDAEALVTSRFDKYLINPRVGIEVLNYRPFFILGEVNKPGSYPYVSGMSVLSAVVLAGGFTPRADEHDISIKHPNDPAAKPQKVDENAPVLPGDILRVNQRLF